MIDRSLLQMVTSLDPRMRLVGKEKIMYDKLQRRHRIAGREGAEKGGQKCEGCR